jgi:DnaJ-class molecular chaperone
MKKKSIWDKDYAPYGTNEGPRGDSSEWKRVFREAMGLDEAVRIVDKNDPFVILGLAVTASLGEIKKAFRAIVKKAHPDGGGDEEAFRKVYAAYTVLKNRFE